MHKLESYPFKLVAEKARRKMTHMPRKVENKFLRSPAYANVERVGVRHFNHKHTAGPEPSVCLP